MKAIQTNFKYTKKLIPLNLDKVFFIILHHTASKTATVEQIHNWHLKAGFNGFGYNEYIRKDGTVYIGRGDHIGAQTANMNSKSYGICVEGNYDTEKDMPEAQFDSLVERIKFNKDRFRNEVKVEKHSLFNPTSCPGKYFPFAKIVDLIDDESKNKKKNYIKLINEASDGHAEKWIKGIDSAVKAAESDGHLGDLEIFKFLPQLIEKIGNK